MPLPEDVEVVLTSFDIALLVDVDKIDGQDELGVLGFLTVLDAQGDVKIIKRDL